MKKIIIAFVFILSISSLFATDIRNVMFGNTYESIEEIKASDFFKQYPEVKTFGLEKFSERDWKEKYYRVYKQNVCGKTFYRVQASPQKLTDEYILQWRNPDEYKNHYRVQLFMEESNELIAILEQCVMNFDWALWENGTTKEYDLVEIIQRNNKIKGFLFNRLVDRIDHHNRTDENGIPTEEYINTGKYYYFDDVINNATSKNGNIKYVADYNKIPCFEIRSDQPLVDSKRPFMYTLQNAYDGNAATAYVENTKDDLLFVTMYRRGEYQNISHMKILNGYCENKNSYFSNNRIKKIGDYYISSESIDNSKTFYSDIKVDVKDVFNEYQHIEWNDSILAVTDIYTGNKYNDTCVSELDFYDEKQGWIFGE